MRIMSVLFFAAALASVGSSVGNPVNVALGKPVVFTHPPKYAFTQDPDDARQLTDGKFASAESFWTDRKACVGWYTAAKEVRGVTVDLGADTPIAGFSWQFAFGRAGVPFPRSIDVYVSIDGTNWSFAGALLDRALTLQGMPPPNQYRVFRAHAEDMPCHGRYVMFLTVQEGYCFCDEVEVYRGDDALLAKPNPGDTTTDPIAFHQTVRLRNHLLEQAETAKAPPELVARISREVQFADWKDKPTVLPMMPVQRDIWAANAARLRSCGFPRPVLWTSDRWENLSPLATPPSGSVGESPVVVDMMRGEVRAETVNVLNPTDDELICDFRIEGFDADSPLDCREVLFTDTRLFRITASALKLGSGDRVSFAIPAGASKQVWISVRRPKGAAGVRRGRIVAALSDGTTLERPFHLRVRDLDFPAEARLHVGGWDYLDQDGKFYRAPDNLAKTLALHREIGLDVPWGSPAVVPVGAKFDAEGNLVSELDFKVWDHWTKDLRPDARQYAVFWSVTDEFCGEKSGTPRFDRMVDAFLKAWIAHARANGLDGRRILLLLVDEPSTKEKQELIRRWMRPIRASGIREFASFEDPLFSAPWECPAEFWELCDVICPITPMAREERALRFWEDLAAAGKEIWLYSAYGPSRTFDPISYYRMQAWTAFRIGSKESATQFWAFGCGGGIGDSWRAYAQTGTEYSPYFVSQTDVMDAKQNEAVREGVEDYEYLSLYAERFGRAKLNKVLASVFEKLPYGDPDWDAPGRDHGYLDRIRVKILDRLEAPSAPRTTFTGFVGRKAGTLLQGRVFSTYARGDVMDEAVRAFETHCDDAVVDGRRHGWWQGEYWGKTMLTHTGAIRYTGCDEEKDFVRRQVRRLVDGHLRPDGYLGTYSQSDNVQKTWNLWGRKYTLWALVEAYEATGDGIALETAERTMDQIIAMLDERKLSVRETGCFNGLPTASILSPLVRLYRHVRKPAYLALMKAIVADWDRADGALPNLIANAFSGKPVHEWYPEPVLWAKSYEMMSCYEGLVDYAALVGDRRALEAAERAADLLAEHETNALGCVGYYDHFTHAAANENATIEMCDVVYWMRLCHALARETGHMRHLDRAERAFCNAFLAGLYEGGRWGAYSVRAHGTRHGTAPFLIGMRHHSCCIDNSPRGFYDMAENALVRRGSELDVNYCLPCEADLGHGLSVRIGGNYPVSDEVTLSVRTDGPLTVSLRVPDWCARLTVDGRAVEGKDGRVRLAVEKDRSFDLRFEKRARIVHRPDLGEPAIAAGEGNDGKGHDGRQFLFELSPRFPEMRGLGLKRNAATVLYGPLVLTKARVTGLGEKEIFSPESVNGDSAWEASAVARDCGGTWGAWDLTLKKKDGACRTVAVCDLPSAAPNDDWQNAFSIWF